MSKCNPAVADAQSAFMAALHDDPVFYRYYRAYSAFFHPTKLQEARDPELGDAANLTWDEYKAELSIEPLNSLQLATWNRLWAIWEKAVKDATSQS